VGRGMITQLVDELIADEVIAEGPIANAPRGRKPRLLHVRTRDRYCIAVDVRFNRTHLALTDLDGRAGRLETLETHLDPAELVAEVGEHVARLLRVHGAEKCEGMGVVVPGMIHRRTGQILNSPQLGWRDVPLREMLAQATGLRVLIENAPIACALAHMWLGKQAGAGSDDFVYVMVSDGVGVGVVVNGEVMRGHDNTAGEFGHVPIDPTGPRCLCGARGCLEAYTSNLATLSRYLGHEFSPTETRDLLHAHGITITDVIARPKAGDKEARYALEETARFLGGGLSVIINTLNPAQIFIGGEITAVWDLIAPTVRAALAARALTGAAAATPIIPESPDAHPRLRGATALVAAPVFAAPQVA